MKSKVLKYILFPVVIGIWGMAIYRYFFDRPDGNGPAPMAVASLDGPELAQVGDTLVPFVLLEEYRDPFLARPRGLRPATEPALTSSPGGAMPVPIPVKKAPGKIEPPKQSVNWSQYRYLGLVSQSEGERQVGLLSVGGKMHSVEVGGMYREMEILYLDADSIQIRLQGEEHKIGRP